MSGLVLPIGERDHIRGPADAGVTLVEYGDFECPHCGKAYRELKRVKEELGSDIRFVYRHFPLSQSHPHALHASAATETAGMQGKFWEMHDALFEHQQSLDDEHLVSYAKTLGLDIAQFVRDFESDGIAEHVREDFMSGVRSGVNGTPTFFIDNERYDGPFDSESLVDILERRLGYALP